MGSARLPGIVGVAAAQLARKLGSPGVVLKSVPTIAPVTESTSTQTWSEDNSLRDTWRVFVAAPRGAFAGRTRSCGSVEARITWLGRQCSVDDEIHHLTASSGIGRHVAYKTNGEALKR